MEGGEGENDGVDQRRSSLWRTMTKNRMTPSVTYRVKPTLVTPLFMIVAGEI